MSNVAIYQPVANAAATKYGIDPTIFSNLIASESSFNPYAINPQAVNGQHATGIAQFLPSTAASLGVDPLNPYSALDGAAKYLSNLASQYGLSVAIAKYKGFSDPNSPAAQSAVAGVIGTPTSNLPGLQKDANGNYIIAPSTTEQTIAANSSKSIWQWSIADLKAAFQSSAWGLVFGVVGLLIIIFSIYMLTKQGGSNSLGAVKKVAGV